MRISTGTARAVLLSMAFFFLTAMANRATAQEFRLPQSFDALPANGLPLRATGQLSRKTLDCSHLVHYLYSRAGLPYSYAPSQQLYSGTRDFRHVLQPRAGDLIVWRGHVGIVVDPQQHTFLSALRSGVKLASYSSKYWQKKGRPRFLRYAPVDANAPELWQRDDSVPGQTVYYRSSSAD
jgi:cell wall-associated NlpC family hydrolase